MTAPQFGVGEWKTRDGRKAVVQGIGGLDSEPYPLEGHLDGAPTCWCRNGTWTEGGGTTRNDLIAPWDETQAAEASPASEAYRKVEELVEKLCKLGNGERDGNSHGNVIAQEIRAALPAMMPAAAPCEIRFNEAEHRTRYEIGEKAIADCFPSSDDGTGIYHLDSGNLQALVHTAIEIHERQRKPVMGSVSIEAMWRRFEKESNVHSLMRNRFKSAIKPELDAAEILYVD